MKVPAYFATSPQIMSDPSFLFLITRQSSKLFMELLTLARGPRGGSSFQHEWCGVAWHQPWQHGASHVKNVSVPKSQSSQPHLSSPSPSLSVDMHMDPVGPLPASSDGFLYILTIIDQSTRWLEAVPLNEMTATSCSAAFLSRWVSRFGVPFNFNL